MKKFLLLLALLPTFARADGLPTTPYIYVQGSASTSVAPDTLTISFSLSVTDMDQAKAKLAVSEKSSAVFKLLKELGVPDQAVIAQSIRSAEKFDYRDGKREFLGYSVQRDFNVDLTDFGLYTRMIDGLFVLRVAEVRDVSPSFSKIGAESDKLKTEALADARKQADDMVAKLGGKVVSVFAVSQIEPGGIKSAILGGENGAIGRGFKALLDSSGGSLTAAGDHYSFEPIKLSESIHVIFLIEPLKK